MELNQIINGWDIGGVNIKAVQINSGTTPPMLIKSTSIPFEIWHNPEELADQLQKAGEYLGVKTGQPHAITITAELSDAFQTKREGILFIIDAVEKAFKNSPVYIFNLKEEFFTPHEARRNPLSCAATNWLASACYIAKSHSNCLLIDIGSTTTDIIPIINGKVICDERTDTGRLINSELVYSGVLRTNPNVFVDSVPVNERPCPVAAEYFVVMADVYLILGDISVDDYTCPTPDRRHKTVESARPRLARLVCADSEILSASEIYNIARHLRKKHIEQISSAITQVLSQSNNLSKLPAIITGTGVFLAEMAAKKSGINNIIHWESEGDCNCLPAFAMTSLLKTHLKDL